MQKNAGGLIIAHHPWSAKAQVNDFLGVLLFPKGPLAEVVRCYRDAGPAEKWAAAELICDENIRFDDWLAGQKSIKTIDVERLVKCLP